MVTVLIHKVRKLTNNVSKKILKANIFKIEPNKKENIEIKQNLDKKFLIIGINIFNLE